MERKLIGVLLLFALSVPCMAQHAGGRVADARQDPRVKVLNNFAAELLAVRTPSPRSHEEYGFLNPREGWVFVSLTGKVKGNDKVFAAIDSANKGDAVVVLEQGKDRAIEAMRYLTAGEHKVHLYKEGNPLVGQLVVRAIPEILYVKLGYHPHVKEYGRYDWDFLERNGFLDNVNVVVSSGYFSPFARSAMKKLHAVGKKYMRECGIPGYHKAADKACGWKNGVKDAYREWVRIGFVEGVDGLIADEFAPPSPQKYGYRGPRLAEVREKYPLWTAAIQRIRREFPNKRFYAYMSAYDNVSADENSRAFVEALMKANCRFALNKYVAEKKTQEAAEKYFDYKVKQDVLRWKKSFPGSIGHLIINLGILTAPPESIDVEPGVDFKVWMDIQMNRLANDPAFRGLYGVQAYTSGYADEEYLRWTAKLYRHYCIEGGKERLSTDPYELRHLRNPDFAEGAKFWSLSPAEVNSITTARMERLGWMQGRYTQDARGGETYLMMRRSAKRPNRISQIITDLEPGRLYSFRMFTSDLKGFRSPAQKLQKHSVSVKIDDVAPASNKDIQHVYRSFYSANWPKSSPHKPCFNFYRRVFRAKSATARITICDWSSEKEPAGPVGQELMFNFIQIQPYIGDQEAGRLGDSEIGGLGDGALLNSWARFRGLSRLHRCTCYDVR